MTGNLSSSFLHGLALTAMSSSCSRVSLLVDGYNIIGSWPVLQQVRDRDGLEMARRDLIETFVNYSALMGYQSEIIFDAHYQNTPAYREFHTPHLSSYYTDFAQTADTYIEKVCAALYRRSSNARTIVATSDRVQQLTVAGYGAEWLSAPRLAVMVEQAARQGQQKVRSRRKQRGRFLFDSLDTESQKRLAQWRLGNFSK